MRIRKLTPRKTWRLMGFELIDFDRASKVCTEKIYTIKQVIQL